MKRQHVGTFEVTNVAGESVRAFIPARLPPDPSIDFSPELQSALEQASLAVGRLDGISAVLPDTPFLLYSWTAMAASVGC